MTINTRVYLFNYFDLSKLFQAHYSIDHHTQEISSFSKIFSVVFCYKHRSGSFISFLQLFICSKNASDFFALSEPDGHIMILVKRINCTNTCAGARCER